MNSQRFNRKNHNKYMIYYRNTSIRKIPLTRWDWHSGTWRPDFVWGHCSFGWVQDSTHGRPRPKRRAACKGSTTKTACHCAKMQSRRPPQPQGSNVPFSRRPRSPLCCCWRWSCCCYSLDARSAYRPPNVGSSANQTSRCLFWCPLRETNEIGNVIKTDKIFFFLYSTSILMTSLPNIFDKFWISYHSDYIIIKQYRLSLSLFAMPSISIIVLNPYNI